MANTQKPTKQMHQNQNKKPKNPEKPPSWAVVRSIFTCKHIQTQQQQEQQLQSQIEQQKQQLQKKKKQKEQKEQLVEETSKKCKKMKCSGSLCSNTKVMQKPEPPSSLLSPEDHLKKRASMGSSSSSFNNNNYGGSSRSMMKAPLKEINGVVSLSSSSSSSFFSASSNSSIGNNNGGSFRGMPFRRFSGCYECRMVVDPVLGMTRDPSLRSTICSCPECGEIFMKSENLELHQAVRHAVSELGPEDTSKNIVEIIFQSSWLKKQAPICKIDRILKVHNTSKTKSNFESYRETIKAKATKLPKKHPRCVADGNELLRFHSTTFTCSLGLNGSSNLCNSIPSCNVCSIIKNGFKLVPGKGILTTATSGKAHDSAGVSAAEGDGGGGGGGDEKMRAMLVCRVIAGRVKKSIMEGNMDEFDSVGGAVGVYSNLDELYVFNPKAILPCFVVIYRGF